MGVNFMVVQKQMQNAEFKMQNEKWTGGTGGD
jgi:hypothetical protein